jgi:hypothetical protein
MINSQNLLLRRQQKRITEHDASREDILSKGIVSEEDYIVLENTRDLFQRGTEIAASPWIDFALNMNL